MFNKFIGRFDQSMLEELDEFGKRYSGTILWLKFPTRDWEMFRFKGVNENNEVHFYNNDTGSVILKVNTDCEIDVRWPERGFADYNGGIIWGTKVPDRQWKRAPCEKNFTMFDVMSHFYGYMGNLSGDRIFQSLFAPIVPVTILDAINLFKGTGFYGKALSKQFAVTLPPYNRAHFLLWYGGQPVAIIRPSKKVIEVKHEYVFQEIKDFNRDHENNVWTLS